MAIARIGPCRHRLLCGVPEGPVRNRRDTMRKRLAMAALTLTVPAAVFTLAATPAEAVTSNTCEAANFIGMYCGYDALNPTTAEYSTNTAAVKEIQDLIDPGEQLPGYEARSRWQLRAADVLGGGMAPVARQDLRRRRRHRGLLHVGLPARLTHDKALRPRCLGRCPPDRSSVTGQASCYERGPPAAFDGEAP